MAITDEQYAAWLRNDNVIRILLIEATYYHNGAEHTVYISNGSYVSRPTDTPANMPYDDSVRTIPLFKSALSDGYEGITVPSWGEIEISNELFDKDCWLDYAWDGRGIKLLYGDITWPKSDFKTVLTGTIASISAPSSSTITLSIRDKQWLLNFPIQSRLVGEPRLVSGNTYKVSDGAVTSIDAVWDNGSPVTFTPDTANGRFTLSAAAVGRVTAQYTGGENTDGQVVPLCFGQCFNISPVLINQSLLKYQVHDGAINAITAIRDNGVVLSLGTNYTVDLENGTFTMLIKQVGTITCDVQGAKPASYITRAGDIISHIITTRTQLTADDIDSASLASFNALCPQTMGIYISDRRNTIDVFDDLVTSLGAWYSFNRAGRMIFGRVSAPTGIPVARITADDVLFGKLQLKSITIPQSTAKIGYQKNFTKQTVLAASVTETAYLSDTQIVYRNNESIKATHLMATEPDTKQTYMALKSAALTEVDRLLDVWGETRKTFSAECILAALQLNMGDLIEITHPRYGLAAGVLLYVIGIEESITTRRGTLTLWG